LPRLVDVHEKAFAALRWMGFREKEARWALERVRSTKADSIVDAERVIREALAALTRKVA
jgi:Holliday junction resolvasome RuvABC DNA-binding subunit